MKNLNIQLSKYYNISEITPEIEENYTKVNWNESLKNLILSKIDYKTNGLFEPSEDRRGADYLSGKVGLFNELAKEYILFTVEAVGERTKYGTRLKHNKLLRNELLIEAGIGHICNDGSYCKHSQKSCLSCGGWDGVSGRKH